MPISIGRTVLDLEGVRARFSPFARARCAQFDFFLHILDQTPQTEVHAENQLPTQAFGTSSHNHHSAPYTVVLCPLP